MGNRVSVNPSPTPERGLQSDLQITHQAESKTPALKKAGGRYKFKTKFKINSMVNSSASRHLRANCETARRNFPSGSGCGSRMRLHPFHVRALWRPYADDRSRCLARRRVVLRGCRATRAEGAGGGRCR